jgi:DNA-binding IclR family transcriptional regulator
VASTVRPQRSGIQSVERAVAILRLLSGPRRRLGVLELAQALDLAKGTVHGILRTLQLHGFVDQDHDSGKYQLGATLLPLGFAYLDSSRLRADALNATHALALRTGLSVRLAALYERQALIIHHISAREDDNHGLELGRLAPLHESALGKALLTQHPGLVPELGGEGLQPFTAATITDAARLTRAVTESARRGWASEVEERSPGVASIAAPIATSEVAEPAAIAVDGPVELLCQRGSPRRELVGAVMESARAANRALGAAPWTSITP